MKDVILGAAGFLGTNLAVNLSKAGRSLRLFDVHSNKVIEALTDNDKIVYIEGCFSDRYEYDAVLENTDTVYHLISTTVPSSNISADEEIRQNVIPTVKLLDACVKNHVKKLVFISSGGTVYGKSKGYPFREDDATNPICSYGIQKLSIEKYIQLYHSMYNLDYRIIRLSNPFGPGQNPKGNLGALTKFTYHIMNDKQIDIFGDGNIIRDYIYIDDAIRGIINIVNYSGKEKLFNLGSGQGYSLIDIVEKIEAVSGKKAVINYMDNRKVDLAYSVLDISKYMSVFHNVKMTEPEEGIRNLINYFRENDES